MNILFISRQSDSVPLDFKLIANKLQEEHEVVFSSKRVEFSLGSFLSYIPIFFEQIRLIRHADVVIIDSYCMPVSLFKYLNKPKVIQIWHAIGLMKKTGYSILGKNEGGHGSLIMRFLKVHHNYDYIFASSESCRQSIAELFDYSEDHIIIQTLPRIDNLFSDTYKKKTTKRLQEKYSFLVNGKKNILYAPTWRSDNDELFANVIDWSNTFDHNKYNLIIKFHPKTLKQFYDSGIELADVIVLEKETSANLAIVCDYLVSDYSSLIYEFISLEKPVFYFSFDLDGYVDERDFYFDYVKEIPGDIYKTALDLNRAIDKECYNLEKANQFFKKYVNISDKGCANQIANFIEGLETVN